MANKKLIIEQMGELVEITQGLLWSGYEVSITPVYEEPEKEDRRYRGPRSVRGRIEHFVIEIGEKIEAPKVDPEQF